MPLSVRPAVPVDAHIAAHLIHSSMESLADFLFGLNSAAKAQNVLAQFFTRPQNRFNYQFADIAESDGNTAGLLLSYSGRTMKHLEIHTGRQLATIYGVRGFIRFLHRSLPPHFYQRGKSWRILYQHHSRPSRFSRAGNRDASADGCEKKGKDGRFAEMRLEC